MATGASNALDETLGLHATASASDNAARAVVFGGVPLAVGLLQYGRFSAEREAQVLAAYAQGAAIPREVRRRLRRRHFRCTAKDLRLL